MKTFCISYGESSIINIGKYIALCYVWNLLIVHTAQAIQELLSLSTIDKARKKDCKMLTKWKIYMYEAFNYQN